ncbi:cell division control protein, partial [Moniliophthora roreri]
SLSTIANSPSSFGPLHPQRHLPSTVALTRQNFSRTRNSQGSSAQDTQSRQTCRSYTPWSLELICAVSLDLLARRCV